MDKPGRNDPCYCGSGEKYKKCHMKIDQEKEKETRQLKAAGQYLRLDLMRFARDERFAAAFAAALPIYWDNYYELENADEMGQDEAMRFFDWFVFDFIPAEHGVTAESISAQLDQELEEGVEISLPDRRLIEIYHEEKLNDLSRYQQAVVTDWLQAEPAGVYELRSYQGQFLQVADYLTGAPYEVYEGGGRGLVEIGELILTRLVRVAGQLELSTTAGYLPAAEIGDVKEKMLAAKTADLAQHPDANHQDFMRRHNHLLIHHALEQAKAQGRPPVARIDPNPTDKIKRKVVAGIKKKLL
jgi:hypothetical protein